MNDSQHLLLEHYDRICNSPPQIYRYAVPFCPSSSWLHEYYSAVLSQEVRIAKGFCEWDTCFRTVMHTSALAIACWKDIIAVGGCDDNIIILDGITGSQKAILSGHTGQVRSVAFSSDGTLLVSGGNDTTAKLWDIQTGGVVKSFHGHTGFVVSVSISADCTAIASGSEDATVHLWDIQKGECYYVLEHQGTVNHVSFSPIDSQCLISASAGKLWQWDISGHKIELTHKGVHTTFSLGKTQLMLCQGVVDVVEHTSFMQYSGRCCLFPGGKLIAVAAGCSINIWDITSSDPHLIKTFVGHSSCITSLAFYSPSSLISSADDQSVKFWQIGNMLVDQVVTGPKSTPLASAPISSITLRANDCTAISFDSNGVVRIWDLSTGHCKASTQSPVKTPKHFDIQLINHRLVSVWGADSEFYIWDTENGELQSVDIPLGCIDDIRIAGDGSKIFYIHRPLTRSGLSIHVWSMLTRKVMDKLGVDHSYVRGFLTVDGPRVWVRFGGEQPQGWEFGTPGSAPIKLSNVPLLHPNVPSPHSNATKLWNHLDSDIKDPITGKVVLQLGGRFAKPTHSQWDGQYLVAGYESGEVLILDFKHVIL